MIAIYKRELKGCFCSLFGWCITAAMVLSAALAATLSNIFSLSVDFGATLSMLSLTLPLFIPILTTYLFTNDNRNQNTPWLASLPISKGRRILGKYAAALTLFLIQAAFCAILPPLLDNFGTVAYGSAYTALLGYFLLAAALLAICTQISSRLQSCIFSMIWGVFCCVALYFLPLLASLCEVLPWLGFLILAAIFLIIGTALGLRKRRWLTGILAAGIPVAVLGILLAIPHAYDVALASVLTSCSLFERMSGFSAGFFDLTAAVFLPGVAVFFLFLTAAKEPHIGRSVSSLLKNRTVLVATLLAVVIAAVNVGTAFLPFKAKFPPVSGSTTYRISDASKRYLSSLNEDVQLIYYVYGGESAADKDLYPFLLQYAEISPRITVHIEDLAILGSETHEQFIVVASQKRTHILAASELFYYYNTPLYTAHTLAEYSSVMQNIRSTEDETLRRQMIEIYSGNNTVAYFTGDRNLIRALSYVTADDAPMIYAYGKGIGEPVNQFLRQELSNLYGIESLSQLNKVPQDCKLLMLAVAQDLTQEEALALSSYLAGGGMLFLSTVYSAPSLPNLKSVLLTYGLSSPDNTNYIIDSQSSAFYASEGATHPATDLFEGDFVSYFAHMLTVFETPNVKQTVLLQSPDTAECITKGASTTQTGSFPICVLAHNQQNNSRVVWLSMYLDSYTHGVSNGENADFVKGLLQWATDTDATEWEIPETVVPSDHLSISDTMLVFWLILFVALLPIALVTVGVIRRYIRRKR